MLMKLRPLYTYSLRDILYFIYFHDYTDNKNDINTDLLYIRYTIVACLYDNEKRLIFASKKGNIFIIEHSQVMHDTFSPSKIPTSNDVACTAC